MTKFLLAACLFLPGAITTHALQSVSEKRERIRRELRKDLLSIQATLDEMKEGSPEIRFPRVRKPVAPVAPPSSGKLQSTVPSLGVEEVERELRSVQTELDELNREGERSSPGLEPFSRPPRPALDARPAVLPMTPVAKEAEPEKGSSAREDLERELRSIQSGLDELNREGERIVPSWPTPRR